MYYNHKEQQNIEPKKGDPIGSTELQNGFRFYGDPPWPLSDSPRSLDPVKASVPWDYRNDNPIGTNLTILVLFILC